MSAPCSYEGRPFAEGATWWEPAVALLPAPAPPHRDRSPFPPEPFRPGRSTRARGERLLAQRPLELLRTAASSSFEVTDTSRTGSARGAGG